MPPDVRRHWRDPRYWEWWWRERVRGEAKFALAACAAFAALLAGFLGARGASPGEEQAAFTTKRVVTIVRTLGADGPPQEVRRFEPPRVVTASKTVTEPPITDVVTVRDRGRTVVVERPGERTVVTVPGKVVTRRGKTVTVPGPNRVVTSTRTETVLQTATTDRPVTVTAPAVTQTVTRPGGPGERRTVTETQVETVTQTVTQPVTVTEETTVTEVVTTTGALITVTIGG